MSSPKPPPNSDQNHHAGYRYEIEFQESYKRAVGSSSYNDHFISHFYREFIGRSDKVAQLFANTNMSAQKTMLHDSLDIMLEFHKTGQISRELQHLARIHGKSALDVPLELYDLWLDSLMLAVKSFDPQYSSDTELAWRLVLIPGITYIKYMADKP